MTVEVSLLELGLGGVLAFGLGFAVRDYFATGASIERIETSIKLHMAMLVLNEAHAEAVEMLGEDDRVDELQERVQDRLDGLSDEFETRNEVGEIDPVGAEVLGPERERVWWPHPPEP